MLTQLPCWCVGESNPLSQLQSPSLTWCFLWVRVLLILLLILTDERNKRVLSGLGSCCRYAGLLLCAHHLNVLAVLLAKVYCGCIIALHKQLFLALIYPPTKVFLQFFFPGNFFFLPYSKNVHTAVLHLAQVARPTTLLTLDINVFWKGGADSAAGDKDDEGSLARMKGWCCMTENLLLKQLLAMKWWELTGTAWHLS